MGSIFEDSRDPEISEEDLEEELAAGVDRNDYLYEAEDMSEEEYTKLKREAGFGSGGPEAGGAEDTKLASSSGTRVLRSEQLRKRYDKSPELHG